MLTLAAILFSVILAGCPAADDLAVVRLPDGAEFLCEIADTHPEQVIGLSQHESLAADRGMLFVYQHDSYLSFWMPPQMKFNLDIIFLDSERRIIHIAADVPPCPDPNGWNCPSYGPGERRGRYVVELTAGTAAQHGLKEGDILEITYPQDYSPPDKHGR
jgi:uncharacterized membrane protein (UPF0127 family)